MRKNLFLIALLTGFIFTNSVAQSYQVHSLYMYSFTKYVKWPDAYSEGDFVIGVLGDSDIIPHLNKMASLKKVGSRLIQVVKYNSVDEIGKCNMLFISKDRSDNFDAVKQKLESTATLLLTEKEGLGKKGSGINFILRQNKLLFELNKTAIDNSGLQISQELVKFAVMI